MDSLRIVFVLSGTDVGQQRLSCCLPSSKKRLEKLIFWRASQGLSHQTHSTTFIDLGITSGLLSCWNQTKYIIVHNDIQKQKLGQIKREQRSWRTRTKIACKSAWVKLHKYTCVWPHECFPWMNGQIFPVLYCITLYICYILLFFCCCFFQDSL